MKLRFLTIFSALICSAMCYGQAPADSGSAALTIRMNLAEATGAMEKDVFDKVRYVPLESSSKSMFGKISQLEVTDEYFIILDQDTNCILFFNKNGKFQGKINGGNKSLNPRKFITRFIINRYKKEIIFKTLGNDNYNTYGFDCKKKKTTAVSTSNLSNDMAFLSENTFVVSNGYASTGNSNKSFLSFFDSDKIYGSALPYVDADYLSGDVTKSSGKKGPFYFCDTDSTLLYTKPYDYNIYRVTSKDAKVHYRLLFTVTNALPNDFLTNLEFKDKRSKFVRDNPSKVFALSNCYTIGDFLVFKASNYDENFHKNFIYNLKTQTLISYEKITPDETSHYLPIAFNEMDFNNNGLAACHGGFVYTDVSSVTLLKSYRDLNRKKTAVSKELAEFIKKNDTQSNPVIVELHLNN